MLIETIEFDNLIPPQYVDVHLLPRKKYGYQEEKTITPMIFLLLIRKYDNNGLQSYRVHEIKCISEQNKRIKSEPPNNSIHAIYVNEEE